MNDALGNKIILGQEYGYARNSNGINTVVIGNAIKFNKFTVTIQPHTRGFGAYDSIDYEKVEEYQKVSMKSMMLFPINTKAIDACRDVVTGYEDDGMEQMGVRDEYFYKVCKEAVMGTEA